MNNKGSERKIKVNIGNQSCIGWWVLEGLPMTRKWEVLNHLGAKVMGYGDDGLVVN